MLRHIGAGQTLRMHFPGGSTFLCELRHGGHLEIMTSHQKSDSVSRCIFTRGTNLPNFIPIRYETTEPQAFLKRSLQQEEQDELRYEISSDLKISRSHEVTWCYNYVPWDDHWSLNYFRDGPAYRDTDTAPSRRCVTAQRSVRTVQRVNQQRVLCTALFVIL